MKHNQHPISLQTRMRFEAARHVLTALIGYAGSRAVTDPDLAARGDWATRGDDWARQLHTLSPRDDKAVDRILTVDAAFLPGLAQR
ncbi:hypothetical protein ACQP2U_43150 (plasmid) [Nocardia sp. CA-084685]|uniref:hypothetical protein n=1 Tax=Nocardia sp. CA-084685 TaxID=3239970 RepID=UPI003D964E8F